MPRNDDERNMKNTTKQIVRHFNHKHSRLFQQLIIEDKLKSVSSPTASAAQTSNIPAANFTPPLESTANNCFTTNQVLVIIAVTCFLNFAFIVLIMMCVQILGSTTNEREASEENALLNEEREELHGEDGLSNWESSRLRIASLPDNLFSRKIAERLLRNRTLGVQNDCDDGYHTHDADHPMSRTYHFEPAHSFANGDSDSDDTMEIVRKGSYNRDFEYPWDSCETEYTVLNVDPRKYKRYCRGNT